MGVPNSGRRVQVGQEVSWGTAVTDTAWLMGVIDASMKPVHNINQVPNLGRPVNSQFVNLGSQWGEFSMTQVGMYSDATYAYESMFGAATPGGAGPYTRSWRVPKVATAVTPDLFTIVFGAPSNDYKLAGALCKSLSIKGEAGGNWEQSSEWIGKAVTTATRASLSDRADEAIRMADTVLSIDAVGGTMGSTAISNALIAFELSVESNRHLKLFNAVAPADYGDGMWDVKLKLTLEYVAAVKAYVDAMVAATPAMVQKQIRLKATGPSSAYFLQLDVAGVLENGPELFGDRDGNSTVDLEFAGHYNTTFTDTLLISSSNGVATLI